MNLLLKFSSFSKDWLCKLCGLLSVLFAVTAGGAWAGESRQYCEDMYPIESYEAEERSQYISECLATTAEEPGSEEDDSVDYQGTVEDFVDSLPTDE